MAEALTRVAARGWQGLEIDEPLPRRLLLSGPNGAGKTARLRAIQIALLGPPNKDGLQPWATTDLPSVVVEASTGLKIQRATRISRSDGAISCANRSAVEPSQGEKTSDAVAARIERELRPNAIALSLDALFAKSGPERRRALLDAIGADAALAPEAIQSALDLDFAPKEGTTAEEALRSGEVWGRIRRAVNARTFTDGFAYLAALEGAAKAQASDYRGQKDAQDALAAGVSSAAAGDVDALRKELGEAQKAVDAMREARAASQRGQQERQRAKEKRERESRGCAEAMDAWAEVTKPAQGGASMLDAWGRGALDEMLSTIATDRETLTEQADASDAAGLKSENEIAKLEAKEEDATKKVSRWRGRLAALDALKDGDVTEGGRCCSACGAPGFDPAKIVARIREERALLEDAVKKHRAAASALTEKRAQEQNRSETREGIERRREVLDDLREQIAAFKAAEAVVSALGTDVAVDDPALKSAEAYRDELNARLEAASKADGQRKAQQDAGRNADLAASRMKRAVEIQARVGPKGLQGELLAGPVRALSTSMNAKWRAAGKPGMLGWELTDARGNPDATLTLQHTGDGPDIALASLSGGERAVALACLVSALAASKPDRMSVALIEAGEIDDRSLVLLLEALNESSAPSLANVVVATHLTWVNGAAGAIEDRTGFEVRKIGA